MSRPLGFAPTPASGYFTATTSRSAGERRIGTQCLRVLPRHTPSPGRGLLPTTGQSIGARLLMFRARAADRAHAASTPGTAWPVHGHLPGLSQEYLGPLVLMPSEIFDASNSAACQVLPSGALERLPGPHLTQSSCAFSLSLTTTVFSQRSTGRFGTCPRRPVPEGQLSSISCTAPHNEEASYIAPPSAFITHLNNYE
jgi:hypothetical protein